MTITNFPPLSQLLRPQSFSDVVGQEHLTGKGKLLDKLVANQRPLSILLWGPPGCGKTTLANLYAKGFDADILSFSAVNSSTAEIKKVLHERESRPLFAKRCMLFIDEIHRFHKGQQDIFLPLIEEGKIILIAATTENPSFSLNSALLSRLRVLEIHPLKEEALEKIIERAEKKIRPLPIDSAGKKALIALSSGDGRHLLNLIEQLLACTTIGDQLNVDDLHDLLQKRPPHYDQGGEYHYNLISALHKSVRGSDPQAALYWLCRMFQGGEDRQFLARRMIRMASEDIGLADPQALPMCQSAAEAYERLGSPEGEIALAEAIVYLALAPKSNAIYTAFNTAMERAAATAHLAPPKVVLNSPTGLMKELGYGKGYAYDHDMDDAFSGQHYFPDGMKREVFYEPKPRGFEREMEKRIAYFDKLRSER